MGIVNILELLAPMFATWFILIAAFMVAYHFRRKYIATVLFLLFATAVWFGVTYMMHLGSLLSR